MDETLLSDLSSYKSYKDKGVMMAARSLIQLYRTVCPDLLLKKDRGRPTEAAAELGLRKFGQLQTREFVPGKILGCFVCLRFLVYLGGQASFNSLFAKAVGSKLKF